MLCRWRAIVGRGADVAGVVLGLWVVSLILNTPSWAASKHQFPAIRGTDILRHHQPSAANEIEFVYLYGALSLAHGPDRTSRENDFYLTTQRNVNIIPFFKQNLYPDIDVYLQAEFIHYTIFGLLENDIFNEIDLIIYENEWNNSINDLKIAQEKIKKIDFSKPSIDSAYTNIFDQYTNGKKYKILDILYISDLTGDKSILSRYKKNRYSILSTRKNLYDFANDRRVEVKHSTKSSVRKSSPSRDSQKYVHQNRQNQIMLSYKRDGIVVKIIGMLSDLLKHFYDNKIHAVLAGFICICCYLFCNIIVLRRYAAKR